MKQLLLAACIGAFTLSAASTVMAQEPAKKTTPKKAAPKRAAKKPAAPAPVAVTPDGVKWTCELGNDLYIAGNMLRDEIITVHWKGTNFRLPRQSTVTGADRYFDGRSGMDLVVIPSKAMLFNRNEGQRLADECQTAEMLAGGSAPTQSGALRAPVATPLLAAPPAAPAPTPIAPAPAPAPADAATAPKQ